ncbi:uncharacterized protein PFL1_04916 [Pseudozyma flocculosa PF-1]|uniref:Related to CWC2 - involved in mRNA splicing n=2 Tax=Pseudozyma flocculosa TaxID=84751 RepID=A0A5C3EV92_9BASI|nr:uncharacterized protein PFL1_04916 [Pseudozyma flocculosa PF-1]EPQ27377.1 hypothetical protein PFL1_04916 [Pseudozyma flocculosa PF-1]SPO36208.1 related to CWC2 - involved in mRNA splicing [Pseudozyma flocculosa]
MAASHPPAATATPTPDLAGPSTQTTTYKPRPARKQVTQERLRALIEAAKPQNNSGGIYNIWHENFSGGDRNEKKGLERAETRCDIARDAGYTKADLATRRQPPSSSSSSSTATPENDGAYCCLFFARGCCPNGAECTYLHRLPRPTEFNDQGRDIFGRPKFGDYRDDMGGVGSMQRVNRTLYVGRIHEEGSGAMSQGGAANMGSSLTWRDGGRTLRGGKSVSDVRRRDPAARGPRQPYVESDTEKVLRRHFGEWGEIERIKVLHGRACAFVTYRHETSAQFAKEAMYLQKLDHNEIINVRWSTDDPNPGAQKRNERQMKQQGEGAILANVRPDTVEAQEALRRLEGTLPDDQGGRARMPEAKRRKLEEDEAAYEAEMARLDEENARGWEEIRREREAAAAAASAASAASAAATTTNAAGASGSVGGGGGLLSAEVVGNLQALSALRQKPQPAATTATAKPTGLGSLAAYGSDSEDGDDDE